MTLYFLQQICLCKVTAHHPYLDGADVVEAVHYFQEDSKSLLLHGEWVGLHSDTYVRLFGRFYSVKDDWNPESNLRNQRLTDEHSIHVFRHIRAGVVFDHRHEAFGWRVRGRAGQFRNDLQRWNPVFTMIFACNPSSRRVMVSKL